jgi:ABC-type multidrug transport system ATPase subunit
MNKDNNTKVILQVTGLCFDYPGRPLLQDLTISIPAGISLIRGEDGCGKTSLLQLFAGELAATSGQLKINDTDFEQQTLAYRQQVFWTDPRSDAFDQISVFSYFETVRRQSPNFDEPLLAAMIAGLGLSPHLDKALYMLSSGSKRKVWLAAAFASGAPLTLLDEPFAALDQSSNQFVMRMLTQAANQADRAWVISHYERLGDIKLMALIDLPSQQLN